MEQEGDQLSNLPITILHNVLSRLPEKDAARISVLSKAWLETWYTFPILSFHDSRFVGQSIKPIKNTAERSSQTGEDLPRKNKDFIEYVKRTLLRFWDQRLAIKEFSLVLNQHPYMSNDVDLCLKLASESNVEVLTLRLPDGSNQGDDEGQGECYVLPKGVIEVKSLNKLELIGGIRVDQAFMNHSIKFFLLRELYLSDVVVEDKQAIERLISCCPLVEFISLFFSNGGMQSLRMQGLQKLKSVEVQRIKEVYIDEASSQLKLHYYNEYLNTPFKIDFIRCKNLKELRLSLNKTILTDKWFLELFKKFPFLEKLDLWNCTMSEKINISSVQLKSFVLSSCSNSKEVNIDAPNLLSCEFDGFGSSKSIISFLRSSSQLEVHVDISTPYYFYAFYFLFLWHSSYRSGSLAAATSATAPPYVITRMLPSQKC